MCSFFLRCCCCCRSKKARNNTDILSNLRNPAISNVYEFDNVEPISETDVLIAKYNYRNSETACIDIKKNDRFTIIEADNPDWNLVKNLETNAIGYAPANIFVDENSLFIEEWYFGSVTRMEVEASLLRPEDEDGTFLIRKSENDKPYPFVLSVKYNDPSKKSHVGHYRIFEENASKEYYISRGPKFTSIADLVKTYHSEKGLCVRLLRPSKLPEPIIGTLSPKHKNWEIPKNEIRISKDKKLGDGFHSTVFYGIWNFSTEVAVKMIKDGTDMKEVRREVEIMKKLNHKNLIKLYGISIMSTPYWIIEEYLANGDLLSFIKKNDLNDEPNMYISYQIADGMAYLESKGIVHRDLAARNILLGDDRVVKIADLGLSRKTDRDGNYIKTSDLKVPIRWMAPENFSSLDYTSKCDVWSFAILLIELYTNGQKPYNGFNNMEVVTKVQAGYRMPKPEKMPKDIYKIVCDCWKANPEKRPAFQDLKATFEALYDEFIGV